MATSAPVPAPPASGGLFNSIGHFFASVAKSIVGVFKGAQSALPVIAKDVSEAGQIAAGIVALLPKADQATASAIESAAYAVLGNATVAVNAALTAAGDIEAAVASGGLNVTLDIGAVRAVQAVLPAFSTLLSKPTSPAKGV